MPSTSLKDQNLEFYENIEHHKKFPVWVKMYLFLFSIPPSEEQTKVPVWQTFFKNLFKEQPERVIIQTLANLIKPELKSKRSELYVSEKLYGILSNFTQFQYGKLDVLMSTKSELQKRQGRVQFETFEDDAFRSIMMSKRLQVGNNILDFLGN